jgi:flagellar biosynthesis protein FliQ
MTIGELTSILQRTMLMVLSLGGPIVLGAMAVGLVVSIFQAATQINESTLTFVPKVLVVALILTVFGPGMLASLVDFTRSIFLAAGEVAR